MTSVDISLAYVSSPLSFRSTLLRVSKSRFTNMNAPMADATYRVLNCYITTNAKKAGLPRPKVTTM